MVFDILAKILVVTGLVGGLVILVRRSKTLSDHELRLFTASTPRGLRFREFWQTRVSQRFPKEEVELRVLNFFEKILRKIRIALTKFDTLLSGLQFRVREVKKRQSLDPGFWEDVKNHVSETRNDLPETYERLDPLQEEKKIVRNRGQNTEAFLNLARLYLAYNEPQDARRVLLAAWRTNPHDGRVLKMIADLDTQVSRVVTEV
ncbi:MAG: tetratricopeptide repeat protein [Parcubacteria group bacterium]|nr:tetratricopeptide repeat protein [Parcubacteria group bacterium]